MNQTNLAQGQKLPADRRLPKRKKCLHGLKPTKIKRKSQIQYSCRHLKKLWKLQENAFVPL